MFSQLIAHGLSRIRRRDDYREQEITSSAPEPPGGILKFDSSKAVGVAEDLIYYLETSQYGIVLNTLSNLNSEDRLFVVQKMTLLNENHRRVMERLPKLHYMVASTHCGKRYLSCIKITTNRSNTTHTVMIKFIERGQPFWLAS